jgi:NAD(P)-dependent dehydrogenase (short-subunit alcohol dehydrogenase family)
MKKARGDYMGRRLEARWVLADDPGQVTEARETENTLRGESVVVVGRGRGIGRAVALLAYSHGARVVVAGRDKIALRGDYGGTDIDTEAVDITDDESIARLATRIGRVDHVVATAAAWAGLGLADLERHYLQKSFDTNIIGSMMLAKHFARQIKPGGSFVLFSGVHTVNLGASSLAASPTDGAVDLLTRWLAAELAPIRVNAVSPAIDAGANGAHHHCEHSSARNTLHRNETTSGTAGVVLFAMTTKFMTGMTLKVDGGLQI